MKILLLEEDSRKRELLRFFLEGRFQSDVFPAATLEEAKQELERHQYSFGMAVCDFQVPSGKELMRFVFESSAPIFFICAFDRVIDLAGSKKLKQWVSFLDPKDFLNKLGLKILSLDPGAGIDERTKSLQYAPVQFSFLKEWGQVPVDLYVKKTATAFSKGMSASSTWTEQHAEIFKDKHEASCMYIKSVEVMPVVQQLQDKLFPGQTAVVENFGAAEVVVEQSEVFDPKAIEELTENLNRLQTMGAKLGFTEEVQNFARQSVQKTMEDVKKSPRLSMILSQLTKDRDQYISSHSMLLSFVACALATQVQWKSDSTYQKLSLAAFLHDITLTNQEIARYDSLRVLVHDREKFSEEDFKSYRTHPLDAAEIARQFTEVPPDVDQVIAQHHEKPDGSGFPRGLTHSRINPLSMVFIVAHDVVRFMLDKGLTEGVSPEHWSEFLQMHAETYKQSQFKKLLEIFKGIQL